MNEDKTLIWCGTILGCIVVICLTVYQVLALLYGKNP